ncbi:MAG: hypothetical protein ACJAT2_003589 [Bacteriovoracaceae bacterium]|jgi:hypothetical protein
MSIDKLLYFLGFFLTASLFAQSNDPYIESYSFVDAAMHPEKYVVLLKRGGLFKKNKDYFKVENLSFYKSNKLEQKIGKMKKDGFYINNEKVCIRNSEGRLLDLGVSWNDNGVLFTGSNGRSVYADHIGYYCKAINYYIGLQNKGEGVNYFFLADKISDKFVEVKSGRTNFYLDTKEFPANFEIIKPPREATLGMIQNPDNFLLKKKEVCDIIKKGDGTKLINYLNETGVKHNLIENNVVKKEQKIFEGYLKDLSKICRFRDINPGLSSRSGKNKKYIALSFLNSYFMIDSSTDHQGGTFRFRYKNKKWRLSSIDYPYLSTEGYIKADSRGGYVDIEEERRKRRKLKNRR